MSVRERLAASEARIDEKRRPTLPAAFMELAGMHAGDRVVVRYDGPGRIVIETPDAAKAEIRRRVRAQVRPTPGDSVDSIEDMRAERAADSDLSDANDARRTADAVDDDASRERGAALLALMGR